MVSKSFSLSITILNRLIAIYIIKSGVVKYREIGLDTHPEYIKRIEREKLREERKLTKEKRDDSFNDDSKPKKKCLIID